MKSNRSDSLIYFCVGAFVGSAAGLLVGVSLFELDLGRSLLIAAGCAVVFGALGTWFKESILHVLEFFGG